MLFMSFFDYCVVNNPITEYKKMKESPIIPQEKSI